MAAVIIRKKNVEQLGKKLLKEVYEFLHDEDILNRCKNIEIEQVKFLKNLVRNHIHTQYRQLLITKEKRNELLNNNKAEYNSNLVKDAMEKDGVDTEGIYYTLDSINFDMDLDEDLYFKTLAFLDIFRVYDINHIYL